MIIHGASASNRMKKVHSVEIAYAAPRKNVQANRIPMKIANPKLFDFFLTAISIILQFEWRGDNPGRSL